MHEIPLVALHWIRLARGNNMDCAVIYAPFRSLRPVFFFRRAATSGVHLPNLTRKLPKNT